ncbi:hypothetical protein EV126DRAFT_17404 [Verticillium dahliae]|nr:hypothetical protein EV126DRAFT_17404 [Verticillium dahliae]
MVVRSGGGGARLGQGIVREGGTKLGGGFLAVWSCVCPPCVGVQGNTSPMRPLHPLNFPSNVVEPNRIASGLRCGGLVRERCCRNSHRAGAGQMRTGRDLTPRHEVATRSAVPFSREEEALGQPRSSPHAARENDVVADGFRHTGALLDGGFDKCIRDGYLAGRWTSWLSSSGPKCLPRHPSEGKVSRIQWCAAQKLRSTGEGQPWRKLLAGLA